jgi:tetratricopeptide (TPR) repeat protein
MNYTAFISYSHADERWAAWLHRRLEHFRDPDRTAPDRHPLHPVFRDRSELSAGQLTTPIEAALKNSGALIVICSPAAVQSRWVAQEIREFKQIHGIERVFPFVVEAAGENCTDSFPETLRYRDEDPTDTIELLAADARPEGDGRQDAFLKLVAGILDVRFDRLKNRADRRRRRRLLGVAGASTTVAIAAVALTITAVIARDDADRRRQQAESLIGFMLGDLSERLGTMGRLDIMDAVGDQAVEYFDSLETRDLTPAAMEQRGRALRQIGQIRVAQNQLDTALGLFEESIALLETGVDQTPSESMLNELAQGHLESSAVHYMREDIAPSLTATLEYQRLMTALTEQAPGRLDYRADLASASNNLGALALASGDTEGARGHFEEALGVAQRLVDSDSANAEYRILAAGILVWLGNVEERLEGDGSGLPRYEAAITQYRSAVEIDPQPANREPLSRVLTIHAVAVRSHDPAASLTSAEEAVDILRGLNAHDPDNADWRQKLNRALTIAAASQLELGCDPQIRDRLEEVRGNTSRLLAEDAGYIENHRDRIDADLLYARYAIGTDDLAIATTMADESVSRAIAMLERNPADNISVRYYLRAVEVLIRARLLAGDRMGAHAAASEALDLTSGSAIDDPRAAELAKRLERISEETEIIQTMPLQRNRCDLNIEAD